VYVGICVQSSQIQLYSYFVYQFGSKLTFQNLLPGSFLEEAHNSRVEILKSQLTTKFTVLQGYKADFSGFLPGSFREKPRS